MKIVWVLVVFVVADGEWRQWEKQYQRFEECEEVKEVITYRREESIKAKCVPIEVKRN